MLYERSTDRRQNKGNQNVERVVAVAVRENAVGFARYGFALGKGKECAYNGVRCSDRAGLSRKRRFYIGAFRLLNKAKHRRAIVVLI